MINDFAASEVFHSFRLTAEFLGWLIIIFAASVAVMLIAGRIDEEAHRLKRVYGEE